MVHVAADVWMVVPDAWMVHVAADVWVVVPDDWVGVSCPSMCMMCL